VVDTKTFGCRTEQNRSGTGINRGCRGTCVGVSGRT